jgi:hypothetical protein
VAGGRVFERMPDCATPIRPTDWPRVRRIEDGAARRVSNINRPLDVAGVYGAAGAGLAVGGGARAIVLTNHKGTVLELSGRQVGLMANADPSGPATTLK